MIFIILALLIFFLGTIFLSKRSLTNAASISATIRPFILLLALATLGFFLLRAGIPLLAGLVAVLMAILPFMQRLISLAQIFAQFHQLFRHVKRSGSFKAEAKSAMTKEEARRILGVSPQATPADIKKAYHAMMRKNHPDQGGSSDAASRINQARDVLLK